MCSLSLVWKVRSNIEWDSFARKKEKTGRKYPKSKIILRTFFGGETV